ncbi:Txe/YoeB family addiction module toxin, partial [Microvirga sp. HBU67558]|uniref:Txe/YoeB family addiction module toxin n=1 Tax=Microvirga sp. HBU67558 TaxID=2824562 RepID=UPI001B39B366
WQEADPKTLRIINDLIKDAKRNPFKGLGKPEPLKHALKGWWSRRITGEHRLVYRITGAGDGQQLEIAQCRYHYK